VQLGRQLGRLERGAADQHRQHRVLLLRHRGGNATARGPRLGQLADLGPAQEQDICGNLPERIQHCYQGMAQ
jgi:hypothetical protein